MDIRCRKTEHDNSHGAPETKINPGTQTRDNLQLTNKWAFAIMNHGDCERHHGDAAIAQSVVRNIGNVEVTSSILVSSSEK